MNKQFTLFVLFFFLNFLTGDGNSGSRETAITRAIEKVGPAVASINVEQHISSVSFDPFFGFMYPREIYPMKSSGSGVVISPDGFVMTNHHVIENADKIIVMEQGTIVEQGDHHSLLAHNGAYAKLHNFQFNE